VGGGGSNAGEFQSVTFYHFQASHVLHNIVSYSVTWLNSHGSVRLFLWNFGWVRSPYIQTRIITLACLCAVNQLHGILY